MTIKENNSQEIQKRERERQALTRKMTRCKRGHQAYTNQYMQDQNFVLYDMSVINLYHTVKYHNAHGPISVLSISPFKTGKGQMNHLLVKRR